MEFNFKDFNHLISHKLNKLNWIDHTGSSLISKEEFVISLDYYKNIGENKDKNQLLVNVYYNKLSICAVASVDPIACENFTKWFFSMVKYIDETKEQEILELRTKGQEIFKKL
jgi:hypothetical protein|tara:strand:- start:467 stop:805 length:339 start_codon:yes stop_codon:yes gene_type:complete